MRIDEVTINSYWAEPTLKSVQKSATSLVKNDPGYLKTFELIKTAPVKRIPKQYFLSDKDFEPYTLQDLADKNLDPRVKQIVQGFKKGNSVPMILATSDNGNIEIYDGFTRAGVAIALGIPLYAKVVSL